MKSKYDERDHVRQVKDVIANLYSVFYDGDMLALYSYLSTDFQRRFPLNYFLIHEKFQQNIGILREISVVEIDKSKNTAIAEITVVYEREVISKSISLHMDYGGWKLSSDIFNDI